MKNDTTVASRTRGPRGGGAHRLLVVHGPEPDQVGRSIALGDTAIEIGRATESLPLPDAQLSRRHAAIERASDGEFRIRDLGSSNGTFVNGVRIGEHVLASEDVIRLGAHVILYQFLSQEACEALALTPTDDPVLVGRSWPMHRLRTSIADAAPGARPVLVLGESGVGKELVAAEVHRLSGRDGSFVPINCAAVPEQLAESELFGHKKGAFTGATDDSTGVFGAADRGTLFLDEIGEVPAALQAKLLRALANGEVRRVGETEARRVDVRVVAATNADLESAVDEGTFRGDLYARLIGMVIRVPPLRERRQDVLPLARHFLTAEDAEVEIGEDAAEALMVHPWRFNVRELEQAVRGAARRARASGKLLLEHLPDSVSAAVEREGGPTETAPAEAAETPIILQVRRDKTPTGPELELVLRHFEGNIAKVATYFSRDRKQVYRWAERLNVDLESFRD